MPILYTIGYEGTDIDRFVATLGAVGIARLADVRAVPHSRKKGFSRKSLTSRLESEGIEYASFQPLGDPKPGRDAARSGHYELFHEIYEAHLQTEDAQSAIEDLAAAAGAVPTCLLCFERDPSVCHRSIVAKRLIDYGFETFDLLGDDPEKYVRNAHRLPTYNSRQSAAAA